MNISRSINRSLMTEAMVLSFVKDNPAAENSRATSTKVGGMVRISLFTATMEVVGSLPTANNCTSLENCICIFKELGSCHQSPVFSRSFEHQPLQEPV